MIFSWCFICFYGQYSDLNTFKCSSRATLRCLAGRMWPAGPPLPRPVLNGHDAVLIFDFFSESKLNLQAVTAGKLTPALPTPSATSSRTWSPTRLTTSRCRPSTTTSTSRRTFQKEQLPTQTLCQMVSLLNYSLRECSLSWSFSPFWFTLILSCLLS